MNPEVLAQISADRNEEKRIRREAKLEQRDAELLTEFGKMGMMASWDDDVILPRHEFKPPTRELYENEKKQRKSRPERPTTDQVLDEVLDELDDDLKAEQEMWLWDADLALESEITGLVDVGKIKNKRELSEDFLDFTAEKDGFKITNYGDITFYDWLKKQRRAVGQGSRGGRGFYYGDEADIKKQDPSQNPFRDEYEKYVKEVKPREPVSVFDISEPLTAKQIKEQKRDTGVLQGQLTQFSKGKAPKATAPKGKAPKGKAPKEKAPKKKKETAKEKKEREKREANEKLKAIREAYQKEMGGG